MAQSKIRVETKQMDTITIDVLDYEDIVVFDYKFCSACFEIGYSQSRVLMIYYSKTSLDKKERIKLYKSMKKIYKNADIYFTNQHIAKNIKTNIITPVKKLYPSRR